MTSLLREYLPNGSRFRVFLWRLTFLRERSAPPLADYADRCGLWRMSLALYDATRLGSAKDGAIFLADRLVFQNNDLQPARTIRYGDIVGIRSKRKLLGGREIQIDLNRARATVTETLDFSGQPGAAEYVERFLQQALALGVRPSESATSATDRDAVADALGRLVADGRLTADDRRRMLDAL